jgi:hypothetical protein
MFLQIVWMLFALLLLMIGAHYAREMPCWGVFLMLALASWPFWWQRVEYFLFRRQLVLEGAMQPGSRIRKVFWKGSLMRVVQVLAALVLAALLLAFLSRLGVYHWLMLAIDVPVIVLIHELANRRLAGTVRGEYCGIVARRWPVLLVNGLLLTLAFMLTDFYLAGVVDTRSFSWQELARLSFSGSVDVSTCLPWGVVSGAVATLEMLAWHGSQLIIPGLPDLNMQYIAWGAFLLRAATVAWLYTALLLGMIGLLERRAAGRPAGTAGNTVSLVFLTTILFLAVIFYAASLGLVRLLEDMQAPVEIFDPATANDCRPDPVARAQLIAQLDDEVAATRGETIELVSSQAGKSVDALFADVGQGVDSYLDWYFTVLGEYQRLAAVFSADVAGTMSEQLSSHLFANSNFDQRLAELDDQLAGMATDRFVALTPQLSDSIARADCMPDDLASLPPSTLNYDALRASVAAGSGVGMGLVTSKLLASKTTSAVVGKVAAKKSFQTGAAVVSKTLAKKGSSTLLSTGVGTAICAPTGPVAILCGVTAGLVTWFSVDKALVELDEAMNREEMRADILAVLDEQRQILTGQLVDRHVIRIDRMAEHVDQTIDRIFIPASDGLGEN